MEDLDDLDGVWNEALEAAAHIAERNVYMSNKADDGGNFGGPASCEYGCGHVIAAAIRALKTGGTL